MDRLTGRTDEQIGAIRGTMAGELTYNELLALAGQKLAEKQAQVGTVEELPRRAGSLPSEAGRDLSVAHTALEDALTRYNSACYRIGGTWKRADPDAAE